MSGKRLQLRGITNKRVLDAMHAVPREQFVPARLRANAYDDQPLPIGHGQTISQPYIVALMSEVANIEPGDRVLEIGTGCGYQTAVLAELGAEVYSIEIIADLADRARTTLDSLGYDHTHLKQGDGYQGWPEHAPFDAIVVTAAPPVVPEPLKAQLSLGAHLVLPVGGQTQELIRITRTDDGYAEQRITPVRFVPMTGEAQELT